MNRCLTNTERSYIVGLFRSWLDERCIPHGFWIHDGFYFSSQYPTDLTTSIKFPDSNWCKIFVRFLETRRTIAFQAYYGQHLHLEETYTSNEPNVDTFFFKLQMWMWELRRIVSEGIKYNWKLEGF